MTTEDTTATGFDRLDPRNLEDSARWLLEHNADPIALVVSLLKTIRQNDDRQQAIRDGYHFSSRCREEMHKAEIDAVHLDIARSIEREARRGNKGAAPNQQLTYAGGLRRAARIARGWRTTRDLIVAPVDPGRNATMSARAIDAKLQESALRLLDQANSTDHGIAAGSAFSTNDRQAKKLRAVALHNAACGVRHALIELGLFPEGRKGCAYPDGDQDCDPALCPADCFAVDGNQ